MGSEVVAQWAVGAAIVALGWATSASGMTAGSVSAENGPLVPRLLLPVLHAPEVHEELALSRDQVVGLEALFDETDGPWFRSRIKPTDEQLPTLDALEQQTHRWLDEHATVKQRDRLRQIELQAQSVRCLLRSDVASALKLSPEQQAHFAELARAVVEARAALQQAQSRGEPTDELQQQVNEAAAAEQDAVKTDLLPTQLTTLRSLLGEEFETSSLTRIYPMAPEFAAVDQWLNSPPLTLAELRGKVVLVHFYAFQCHNCHANFNVYRRWHDELRDRGVVVIGIQTPETSTERDPEAVRAAAREQGLEFPIMIDLESKNWNAWANTMWPTVYVVDKNGYLRYWWQGELNWQGATGDQTVEGVVEAALAEPFVGD